MKKKYVVEANEAIPQKKEFLKKNVVKKIFEFYEIFFEVIFESDHSHILREHALKNPSQHIFFFKFFKGGGDNVKTNKNHACNTAHRYGELLPIAYFGTQLYCIFSWLGTLLKIKIAL